MKTSNYFKRALKWYEYIAIPVLIWLGITCAIQRFKCPQLTETEIFLRSDQCAMLDFVECENR